MNTTDQLLPPCVERFREIVIWPVQLMPRYAGTQIQNHWECLSAADTQSVLMLSNRLVMALSRLDIRQPKSVPAFRREVRHITEIFLRFTHRYWFHEISDQAQARDSFTMMADHLGTDKHYERTRLRILGMNDYLERDELRRQADTVVRLTVVTTFGLIGP